VAAAQIEVTEATARVKQREEDIALVEDELAATRKELKPWRLRTARRGAALRSTRGVVALVAPVQEELHGSRREAHGDGLRRGRRLGRGGRPSAPGGVPLGDLRRTPAADLSKEELREHANALRARAAAVGTARAAFVDAQGGYGDTAELVDARLDSLTRAIAGLRKQIAQALRR
jgi:hypothetical protein